MIEDKLSLSVEMAIPSIVLHINKFMDERGDELKKFIEIEVNKRLSENSIKVLIEELVYREVRNEISRRVTQTVEHKVRELNNDIYGMVREKLKTT